MYVADYVYASSVRDPAQIRAPWTLKRLPTASKKRRFGIKPQRRFSYSVSSRSIAATSLPATT